jgi:hypothetical protein
MPVDEETAYRGKVALHANVAVHPAEGRREAPLPRIGCNGWLAIMFSSSLNHAHGALIVALRRDK